MYSANWSESRAVDEDYTTNDLCYSAIHCIIDERNNGNLTSSKSTENYQIRTSKYVDSHLVRKFHTMDANASVVEVADEIFSVSILPGYEPTAAAIQGQPSLVDQRSAFCDLSVELLSNDKHNNRYVSDGSSSASNSNVTGQKTANNMQETLKIYEVSVESEVNSQIDKPVDSSTNSAGNSLQLHKSTLNNCNNLNLI